MTFPAGSIVRIPRLMHGHDAIGTVKRSLAGQFHEVELSDGQVIPCLGDVLIPAPANVLVFKRKPANPYGEMYEND